MRIRNIRLHTIEARRYIEADQQPKPVRINHNTNVTQIQELSYNQATIAFEYTTSYGPVGVIKLQGSLLFEDEMARKLARGWKTSRKLPDQITGYIFTAVMHVCIPHAVGNARRLGLPLPIPLPQVKVGAKPQTAAFGPEVA